MIESPLFSIIVPSYNRCDLLMESIQSVLDQSCNDWELLVINDGSSDTTAKEVASIGDERIKYFYLDRVGRSAARNHGILKSNGSYVLFLDDDDLLLPHHLKIFGVAIRKNNSDDPTLYRTGFLKMKRGAFTKAKNYLPSRDSSPLMFIATNMCGVGSLCIPKVCLVDDSFPEQFSYWEDTHLFLRLVAKYNFVQLADHSYVYRIHDRMGSRNIARGGMLKAAEEIVGAMDHLFASHQELLIDLYPDVYDYLVREKKLQFLVESLKAEYYQDAAELSKELPVFDPRFWEYYFKIWILSVLRYVPI